jgi:uncharacterized protein involved in cysteine biosynthesis
MSTPALEEQGLKRLRPAPTEIPTVRSLPADPTAAGVVGRFLQGVQLAGGGVGLVFSDARLMLLSLIPMVIHVALLVALLVLGFAFVVDPLIAWVEPMPGGAVSAAAGAWHAVWSVAVQILVGALVVGLALVGTVVSGSIVCDPFYDALSERTEALHVGHDVGPPFSVSLMLGGMVRELLATLLRLVVYGTVAVPLWLLSFTPAALVATPLALVWTWLFFAYEFLARSMVRHAARPTTRMGSLFAHKSLFVGFGLVCWVLSFVPLTAPLLVVAGTRLYLTLASVGKVPSTLSDDDKAVLQAHQRP